MSVIRRAPLLFLLVALVALVASVASAQPAPPEPASSESASTETTPSSSTADAPSSTEAPAKADGGEAASDAPAVRVVQAEPVVVDHGTSVLVESVLLGETTPGPLSSPSSALFAGRTSLLWLGVRAGALTPVAGDVVVGGDGALLLSRSTQGTAYVGETWTRAGVEGRGLVGYRLSFGRALLTPYALASARLELGIANLTVLRQPSFSPLGGVGARVGAGLALEAGGVAFRTDCANGARTFSFDVACTLGVGARF